MKFIYKHLLVGLAFYAFAAQAHAQQLRVTGTVTDSLGVLSGVNVAVKNKPVGTITNFDGEYVLTVQPNDTLVFSYIGYKTVTIPLKGSATIDIQMQKNANALKEVVINAGYYSTTKRESTGSISRITTEEIEKQPVTNVLAAMQGRMTGVHIVQNSGVPGGGFEVRIRGQNSIMAGNEPLYVIDGVPYPSQTLGSRTTSGLIIPGGNISPLNAINPDMIKSIEVLKDADATAIYGSRGANGVVLITTKKGKAGKTKFTISSSTGTAHITKKMDLLNTEQYLEMRTEAFANDGITEYPATAYDINGTWDKNRYTDWQKVLIGGTAKTQKIQGMVSGGSEQTQFLLSGMYQNETTVYPGNFNYDRISVNSNVHHSSENRRFEMLFKAGYTIQNNRLPTSDLTRKALILAPNAPSLYDENGNLNWENSTWTNPLAELQGEYTNNSNNLIANSVLNYRPFDGVEIKINSGYTFSILEDYNTRPHTVYDPAFGLDSRNSSAYTHRGRKSSVIIEPQMNWTWAGENSSWKILLGATFEHQEMETLTLFGADFANNTFLGNLSAANILLVEDENNQVYKYQSIFTRINYGFRNKLFLNITGRRDGSSRFGPGNRYGNFGAIGAAWLFSEELDISWLNYGKLRGSYGITGNDQILDYEYMRTYIISDSSYDGNIGLEPARLYNPHYQWEVNKKTGMAIEMGFLENTLFLSTAYYNNRSSNQLINYALPGTTGFSSIRANLDALVENSGWEFQFNATIFGKENFDWNTSFNISLPKNELLEFPGLKQSTYANRFVIGKPLNIAKLYHLKGVNPETGLFEFTDYNGDGLISAPEDRQYIADLTPSLFGGLSNTLNYKNWSLNIFFQFVKKKGFNEFYRNGPAGILSNQPISVLNRWQMPGDRVPLQRFTTGADMEAFMAHSKFIGSSGIVSDASFIRLKSMAISYSLHFGKENNTSCKISLQGQNLLTFTRFKGGDPEQIPGFLPPLRRISLGVDLRL